MESERYFSIYLTRILFYPSDDFRYLRNNTNEEMMNTISIIIENPSSGLTGPWMFDEKGRLIYQATKENDPYFSNFLESVLVEGEDVKELVLSGMVSEIVQQEWNGYYSLIEWMKTMDSSYMTEDMKRTMEEWSYVRAGVMTTFRLSHVEKIMRILNPPKNWEMCVLSTDDPIHMETVGRQVMTSGASYYPSWSDDALYFHAPISRMEVQLNIPRALVGRMVSHSPPELRENVRIALYGGMRLGVLSRRSSDVLPLWLDWSTILSCMDRLSIPHESIAYNSVAMLCGKGDVSLSTIPAGAIMSTNAPKAFIRTTTNIWHLIRLYHAILPSYPEDVGPISLGLGRMIGYGTISSIDTDISQIVPFLHSYILELIPHYARSVRWPLKLNERQLITANVHLLISIVGSVGSERILQSLRLRESQGGGSLNSMDYIRELTHALNTWSSSLDIEELETCIVKYLIKISK